MTDLQLGHDGFQLGYHEIPTDPLGSRPVSKPLVYVQHVVFIIVQRQSEIAFPPHADVPATALARGYPAAGIGQRLFPGGLGTASLFPNLKQG